MKLKMKLVELRNMKIRLLEIIFLWFKKAAFWFDFIESKTIRSFGDDIYNKRINMDQADQEQSGLLDYFFYFNNKTKPKSKKDKNRKSNVLDSVWNLYKGR